MLDRCRHALVLFALLVLAAMILAACGSGDSSDPLTKAEFLKQGNEICAEVAPQQQEAVEGFDGAEAGPGELEEVVEAVLGPMKDLTGELSSLEGPPAQMKAVKVYVTKLEAAIATAEAKPAAAVSGSVFQSANAAAERAGLRACVI